MGARRTGGRSARGWEKLVIVLLLFAFTKPFFYRAESGSSFGVLENGLSGNIYLGIVFLATLALVLRRPQEAWNTARGDLLLWALIAMAVLSFLWSVEPYVSFRAGVLLIATSVAGVLVATSYSNAEQVEITAAALGLGAALSLVAGLGAPAYGQDGGNWLGIFLHKNHLGRYMALGAIAFALLAGGSGAWRRWAPIGFLLSALLVFLSGSSTASVVVLALAGLVPLFIALGAQVHLAVAILSSALLCAGLAVIFFLLNQEAVLHAFSRDVTLTGRTALWPAIIALVSLRPWLGYGFQAFWFIPESSEDVKDMAGWVGTSAHNGFLEIALGMGLVGVALFALGLLRSGGTAIRNLRRQPGLDAVWPAAFLAYFLAYNLTETSVLLPNNILWVLYVAVVLSLRRKSGRPEQPPVEDRRMGRPTARSARGSHRLTESSFRHAPARERPG